MWLVSSLLSLDDSHHRETGRPASQRLRGVSHASRAPRAWPTLFLTITQNTWDPQLNAPDRSCPCNQLDTFLGDYFGNEIAGQIDYATFVSTYDDGSNPHHYQQQVVATISLQ